VQFEQSKEENELLSLINATVSHELRNPLNSILAENMIKEALLLKIRNIVETTSF